MAAIFKNGKAAFNDAQCILCHRFGNEGGFVGPELTAASSKYARKDILESILEPSQSHFRINTRTSWSSKKMVICGNRLARGRGQHTKVALQPNPLSPDRITIVPKSEILERRASHVSPMPEGLLNQFTKEDILDMLSSTSKAWGKKRRRILNRPNRRSIEFSRASIIAFRCSSRR